MLLRLLPVASPSQPNPPTILFTLPLPTNPYTSRGLPLPPNLLAHRSLCLQEDVDCTNVLLGDKASWLWGVVDDCTFSLPHKVIIVRLVDGSIEHLSLSDACVEQLHRVINEVQSSFNAPTTVTPLPVAAESPRQKLTVNSLRRTPSSLLFSLLSPLLPTSPNPDPSPPAHVAVHHQPARAHRRQARSLLVDAYRRFVHPHLKNKLPSAFLLWAIQSETTAKMEEYGKIKEEIETLLQSVGLGRVEGLIPLHRCDSAFSSSTVSSCDDSRPSSPMPSERSVSSEPFRISPSAFLMTIPPSHSIPLRHRTAYNSLVSRLTQLSSRLGSISKLASRYEKEEDKRTWLEHVDLNNDAEKACRRAVSNGLLRPTATCNSVPLRRSPLSQSVTAEDVARLQSRPAMDDIDELLEETSEPSLDGDRSITSSPDLEVLRTPTSETSASVAFTSVDDSDSDCSSVSSCSDSACSTPQLIPSRSDDSLNERDDWECESYVGDHDPIIPKGLGITTPTLHPVWDAKNLPPLPAPPTWHSLEVY